MQKMSLDARLRPSRASVVALVVSAVVGVLAAILPASPALAGTGKWTTSGPKGGSVLAVAINPAGSTVYIGTGSGGVEKATNGGTSRAFRHGGISRRHNSETQALAIPPPPPANT